MKSEWVEYPIEAIRKFLGDPTLENLTEVRRFECEPFHPSCKECIFSDRGWQSHPGKTQCRLYRLSLAESILAMALALAKYEEGGAP